MKRSLHNLVNRIKSRLNSRTRTDYVIHSDDIGVCIGWHSMENEQGSYGFTWDSVLAVDTYKRDEVAVDCICLVFETPKGSMKVDEDMAGWGQLLDQVESSLPEFPSQEDWYREVMLPPFATNYARLWTKPLTQPRPSDA